MRVGYLNVVVAEVQLLRDENRAVEKFHDESYYKKFSATLHFMFALRSMGIDCRDDWESNGLALFTIRHNDKIEVQVEIIRKGDEFAPKESKGGFIVGVIDYDSRREFEFSGWTDSPEKRLKKLTIKTPNYVFGKKWKEIGGRKGRRKSDVLGIM